MIFRCISFALLAVVVFALLLLLITIIGIFFGVIFGA
jgi:hypothetical protein